MPAICAKPTAMPKKALRPRARVVPETSMAVTRRVEKRKEPRKLAHTGFSAVSERPGMKDWSAM